MLNEKKIYFGKDEVVKFEEEDHIVRVETKFKEPVIVGKNENGEEITDTGEKFSVPLWEWEAVANDEPLDATEERRRRSVYVTAKILNLLKDLDVRTIEIPNVLQRLTDSLQANERRVNVLALGKNEEI